MKKHRSYRLAWLVRLILSEDRQLTQTQAEQRARLLRRLFQSLDKSWERSQKRYHHHTYSFGLSLTSLYSQDGN